MSIQDLKDYREKVKAARPLKRRMQSKQINQSVDDNAAMSGSTSSVSCSAVKMRVLYIKGGVPIWRNREIGLFVRQSSEKLHVFWRISENRNIVGQETFVFSRNKYGKVQTLRTLISLIV